MLKSIFYNLKKDGFLLKIVFGFAVGCLFGVFLLHNFSLPNTIRSASEYATTIFSLGVAFIGLPYVWEFIPSVLGFGILGIVLLPFKIAFGALIGFFVVPVVFVYRVLSSFVYSRR